jgi:NADH:ubiquinone oxidoreductase subunit E
MTQQAEAAFSVEAGIAELENLLAKYESRPGATIPILQDMQEAFGFLPEEAVNWIADRLGRPRSSFFGVATFYSQFHLKPRGKNVVTVCCGTACHVKGAEKIMGRIRRDLDLPEGKDTTDDLMFTIEKANCVGACSIAPVVINNKEVLGKATPEKMGRALKAMAREGAE